MHIDSEPGVILHRRDYRDSSLILDVFTRQHGRLGLLAQGAKRPRGRWRGLLEPLRPLSLGWRGRSELKTLTQADPMEPVLPLQGLNLYAGFYIAELIMRLTTRDDPHPELFDLLLRSLGHLSADSGTAVTLRLFEKYLLEALGYGLPLDTTQAGEALRADACYSFEPDAGFIRVDHDIDAASPGYHYAGDMLLALAGDNLEHQAHLKSARQLLQAALSAQLGDRPLKSAATLRAMQALRKDQGV